MKVMLKEEKECKKRGGLKNMAGSSLNPSLAGKEGKRRIGFKSAAKL